MTTVTASHSLWRNRRYLTWLVSDTSRGLASTLFAFAIPLLALIVTDDPAQAGIIGGIMLKQSGGTYETASAPTAQNATGSFALVRFAAQATQDDVTQFLARNKLSIVAGPMNGGLYRVKIAPEKLSQADVAVRIQELQDNKIVALIVTSP